MGVLLAALSALTYGASDFAGGLGGRRADTGAVTILAQSLSMLVVAAAVLAGTPRSPTAAALGWGALAGVGGGGGTVALYRGLAGGQMNVVAPVSGVLSAGLPVLVGIGLGDRLSALAVTGIVLAGPAIVLVSLQRGEHAQRRRRGISMGLAAGAGFALLFIALHRAGTSAGAWPLLPAQVVAVVVVVGLTVTARPGPSRWRASWRFGAVAGVLSGAANLLYLASTGHGQLSIVAVVTALYPAVTVLLARAILHERWDRLQVVGLVGAVFAVGLISAG